MMRIGAVPLLLLAVAAGAADESPLPEVATALERIQGRSTIDLTTTGRKSGKEHTRPVWFVVSEGKIVVQAGKDGKTDWYQNLLKTPTAVLRNGGYVFRARARPIADLERVNAIHRMFLDKYTSAWLFSFLGSSIGRGKPMELEPVAVAVLR